MFLNDFIEKHIDEIDLTTEISHNLPVSFCLKHYSKIPISELVRNYNLPSQFYEDHLDLFKDDLTILLFVENLSQKMVEMLLPLVDTTNEENLCHIARISRNENCSQKFFEKNIDKLYWPCLSRNKNISQEFLEKNIDKINWFLVGMNSGLNEEFYKKHIDKIRNKSFNFDYISTRDFSVEFFEENLPYVDWHRLSKNEFLPISFFEKHCDKIKWGAFLTNKNLTFKFMEKYMPLDLDDEVSSNIFRNESIPLKILKMLPNINWDYIYENGNIPVSFFEKNIDKIHISDLLFYNNFKYQIFLENKIHSFSCFKNDF